MATFNVVGAMLAFLAHNKTCSVVVLYIFVRTYFFWDSHPVSGTRIGAQQFLTTYLIYLYIYLLLIKKEEGKISLAHVTHYDVKR